MVKRNDRWGTSLFLGHIEFINFKMSPHFIDFFLWRNLNFTCLEIARLDRVIHLVCFRPSSFNT